METILNLVAQATGISIKQTKAAALLLEDGATILFISRYRKERTGGLNEEELENIQKQLIYFQGIVDRKLSILASIEKQDKLTDELKSAIENTWDANVLEDLYLPYKQKRKTRATIAKEKGLEPLAEIIFKQENIDINKIASSYLNDVVLSVDEAIQGAKDIIAEQIRDRKSVV